MNDKEKAMELVTATRDTLRVTANMLRTASLLFTIGVEPREGLDEAVRSQLEVFENAVKALNALADVYQEIGNDNPITEASSWS